MASDVYQNRRGEVRGGFDEYSKYVSVSDSNPCLIILILLVIRFKGCEWSTLLESRMCWR